MFFDEFLVGIIVAYQKPFLFSKVYLYQEKFSVFMIAY